LFAKALFDPLVTPNMMSNRLQGGVGLTADAKATALPAPIKVVSCVQRCVAKDSIKA
jgi:hypothetical protein